MMKVIFHLEVRLDESTITISAAIRAKCVGTDYF